MTTTEKNLGDGEFRKAYTKFSKEVLTASKKQEWRNKIHRNETEWAHKQLCLKHKLYPDLIKSHFTTQQIPPHLLNICQCGKLHKKVNKEFEPLLRISLEKAAEGNGDWKMKNACFTDLNLSINNDEVKYNIQLLKIKIGAVKRYTQPTTVKNVIGCATFWQRSVFFEVTRDYVLEFKLKGRFRDEKVKVAKSKTAKDVAPWWYQCWVCYLTNISFVYQIYLYIFH